MVSSTRTRLEVNVSVTFKIVRHFFTCNAVWLCYEDTAIHVWLPGHQNGLIPRGYTDLNILIFIGRQRLS